MNKNNSLHEIVLKPLTKIYINDMITFANDIRVAQSCHLPYPFTLKNAQEIVTKSMHEQERQKGLHFAICQKEQFVGVINLGSMPKRDQVFWLSYWVGFPFWGQGFASTAVTKLLDSIKRENKVSKVYTAVWDGNGASKHILQKNGFKKSRCRLGGQDYHNRFRNEKVWEMLLQITK